MPIILNIILNKKFSLAIRENPALGTGKGEPKCSGAGPACPDGFSAGIKNQIRAAIGDWDADLRLSGRIPARKHLLPAVSAIFKHSPINLAGTQTLVAGDCQTVNRRTAIGIGTLRSGERGQENEQESRSEFSHFCSLGSIILTWKN